MSPADPKPYQFNDAKFFNVAAATHVDLDVLPVLVGGGQVTIGVKNVGTTDAGPLQHLLVKKLPNGAPVDHGPVGPLAVGKTKQFPKFNLPAGDYSAYVDPPDLAPYQNNDSEDFKVVMMILNSDLEASVPVLVGGHVTGFVKKNGPGNYAGTRQWRIEKKVGMNWLPAPTNVTLVIGPLNAGASFPIDAAFTGPGTYRIRITPGDGVPGNDVKTKMLP